MCVSVCVCHCVCVTWCVCVCVCVCDVVSCVQRSRCNFMPHCLLISDEIVGIALALLGDNCITLHIMQLSLSLSLAPPANSTAPTFTIAPVDTVAITGSRVIIECLGQAHPTPTSSGSSFTTYTSPKRVEFYPLVGSNLTP